MTGPCPGCPCSLGSSAPSSLWLQFSKVTSSFWHRGPGRPETLRAPRSHRSQQQLRAGGCSRRLELGTPVRLSDPRASAWPDQGQQSTLATACSLTPPARWPQGALKSPRMQPPKICGSSLGGTGQLQWGSRVLEGKGVLQQIPRW
ncbi:hypothetical protein KIL84_002317 [Mauremys mutica]|uniref:Uncharacterized protein n=1 Tax=Mauremys mutica TaxID=74926 RepID=A0A9D3X7A3_9SAUR|nr:hypothetical protein KIL84_002317 [Mauremys mutica]